jgi:hypothetical protein
MAGPLFRVVVDDEVELSRLLPDAPDFAEARERVIQRESHAIERFHKDIARRSLRGRYYFATLIAARGFALLCLKAAERRIAANIDRVLDFDDD